ncbi:VOC family protein [Phycicoccus avicenniae]|uniref:VOC family protein n=1 Tax=Phycicoccus avicenniae TaxID=2828860 RepID=UPI003D2683FB
MELENLVLDARDPQRLGAFWEALLGGRRLTDEPDIVETRLSPEGAPVLDLCMNTVPEPAPAHPRLHLDLLGGDRQDEVVARALALGARHLDIGQGDVPWVVLADVEGNPFCVMEHRPEYRAGSPVAALPLDCADVERALAFWTAVSGWVPEDSAMPAALRHPSGHGPLLELCPEPRAKPPGEKNRLHLDARLAPGEDLDEAVEMALDLGGREVDHGWGDLPWRVLTDPSGNEVCLLPPHRT